jgi:hypothetical protein
VLIEQIRVNRPLVLAIFVSALPTRRNIDEGRFVAAGLLARIKIVQSQSLSWRPIDTLMNIFAVTLGRICTRPVIVETCAWRDGFRPASALPMPLPAIPSVEQVGESIIAEARNRMDHR